MERKESFKKYDLKIISGGQTGVDQGALDSVFEYMTQPNLILKISCGGTAPQGYWTEEGEDLDLKEIYGLKQSEEFGYIDRTKRNVIDSDGTLIISSHESSGTELTKRMCLYLGKPTFHIQIKQMTYNYSRSKELYDWIVGNNISILNVAGHRESRHVGIEDITKKILMDLYTHMENEFKTL